MKEILKKKLEELPAEVVWGGITILSIITLLITSVTIKRIIDMIVDIVTSFS